MNISKAYQRDRKKRKEQGFSDEDEIRETIVTKKKQKKKEKIKKSWYKEE